MSKIEWQLAKLEAKHKKGEITDDVYRIVKLQVEEQSESEPNQRPSSLWQQEEELVEAIEIAARYRPRPQQTKADMPPVDPLTALVTMRANGEISAGEFALARERLAQGVQTSGESRERSTKQSGLPAADTTSSNVASKRQGKSAVGIGLLISFFAIGTLTLFGAFLPRDPCSDKVKAFVLAEQAAEAHLKSPSTAEFASFGDNGVVVTPIAGCILTVKSYVDAQNGFGAVVRNHFIAQVSADKLSDKWKVIDFRFENNLSH